MNILSKYKKWWAFFLLVAVLALSVKYGYKKYSKYKHFRKEQKNEQQYEDRFNESMKEAAKIPDTYWDEKYQDMAIKDKYKVIFVTNNGGEYSHAEYFKYAAEKLGWEVKIYSETIQARAEEVLAFDPDFIIFSPFASPLLDDKVRTHRARKYLFPLFPIKIMRDKLEWLSKRDISELEESSQKALFSMVDGVLTTTHEVDIYREVFEKMNKSFNGRRALPLTPLLKNEPAEPNTLMWVGLGWDNFRASGDYKEFITLLNKNTEMKVYGPYKNFTFLEPHVYDGYITPGMKNIEAIQQNGIYLLTHSDWHIQGGEPSVRLFEAVAANVVIISDKHPFALEHFGDSFLYFDQNADAQTKYQQVKAHYDWIKSNPEKAKAMAAKAHQTFLDKFNINEDLVKIAKMHEYVVKQIKNMDLRYELVY